MGLSIEQAAFLIAFLTAGPVALFIIIRDLKKYGKVIFKRAPKIDYSEPEAYIGSVGWTEVFHKAIRDQDFETMERMMREAGTWTEEEELVFPTITS